MSNDKKINIPASLTSGMYTPQPEMLEVATVPGKMLIGIPKEITLQENRVGLVPSGVASLVANGHRVIVESGAGENSHFKDLEYSEAGAEIVHSAREVYEATTILKISPPTLGELELMQANQTLISPLHLPIINQEYLRMLIKKRVTALAMEYIRDEAGSYPVVRAMSELAGISAMHVSAELMSVHNGGRGILLGGITGVPPAKVVILGAGVVAEYATRTAIGLGADVRILDNNIYKLKRLQSELGRLLYTSTINPIILERMLRTADVVIGAIHSKSSSAPLLVSEEMVMKMKPGSIIVDISIDQGGCFETSRVTTHDKPTFVKHGIIHYCVPNVAARVPRTASIAANNILTSILSEVGDAASIEYMLTANKGMRNGVYAYKGCLTNAYLGKRFDLKSTDINLLLPSLF